MTIFEITYTKKEWNFYQTAKIASETNDLEDAIKIFKRKSKTKKIVVTGGMSLASTDK